jgi:hypothetical protein
MQGIIQTSVWIPAALSASLGVVVSNGDATLAWFWAASDDLPHHLVTITATDSDVAQSMTSFALSVENLAPTVTAQPASGYLLINGSFEEGIAVLSRSTHSHSTALLS